MPEGSAQKKDDESSPKNGEDKLSIVPKLSADDALAEPEESFNYGGIESNGRGGIKPLFPCCKQFFFEEGPRRFWLKNDVGQWVDLNESGFERELKIMGCRTKILPKSEEVASPAEKVISDVQMNHRVAYAGALAGYKMGVYNVQARKILVTHGPHLVQPAKGAFPLLKKFEENQFCDPEAKIDQRPYLWSWMKQTLQCLYSGNWAIPGALCLGICGPAESGKSLFLSLLKEMFGGRVAKPYAWMIGRDSFNEEMFEAVLQVVDDETSDTTLKGRLHFAAQIKIMTAVDGGRCRGMQKKAMELRPLWRLVILCNDEPDRMQILPPLDDDIVDKLLLLKSYKREFPFPLDTDADKIATRTALSAELSAYVWWLLNEWQIPKELHGRFGVIAWQHPDIVDSLLETSPALRQWNFIERVMGGGARVLTADVLDEEEYASGNTRLVARRTKQHGVQWRWKGSASDLEADLKSDGSGLTKDEQRHEVQKPTYLGRNLQKLVKVRPQGAIFVFKHVGEASKRCWIIRSGEHAPE